MTRPYIKTLQTIKSLTQTHVTAKGKVRPEDLAYSIICHVIETRETIFIEDILKAVDEVQSNITDDEVKPVKKESVLRALKCNRYGRRKNLREKHGIEIINNDRITPVS